MYLNTELKKNFENLIKLLELCLFSEDFNQRPDCEILLDRMSEWSVDKECVLNDKNIENFRSNLQKPENEFLRLFFENKTKNNCNSIK